MSGKVILKRVYAFVLSLALIAGSISLPSTAMAAEQDPNDTADFVYTMTGNGAVITNYKNRNATEIHIPRKIDGVRVTKIAKDAFIRMQKLEVLTIPDTVTEIESGAFQQTAVKEVVIPGTVTTLGARAFYGCIYLEKVAILYGVRSIGDGAFAGCSRLSQVEIAPETDPLKTGTFKRSKNFVLKAEASSNAGQFSGDGTNTISHQTLSNNSSVVYAYETDDDGKVTIKGYHGSSNNPVIPDMINGNPVEKIGDGAFQNKPINTVKLPESIKIIGSDAFAGTNIKFIHIPAGVTSVGNGFIDDVIGLVIESDSLSIEAYISKYFANVRFQPYGPGMPLYHKLDIRVNGNGRITLGDSARYKVDKKVSISAAANKGYVFTKWTVSGKGTFEDAANPSTTFTMPDTDTTITANFEKKKRADCIYQGGKLVEFNTTGELNILTMYSKSNEDKNQEKIEVKDDTQDAITTTGIAADAFMHYVSEDGRYYYGYPTSVVLPQFMKDVPNGVFKTCNTLESITVTEPNKSLTSVDGVLFNDDKTVLLCYPRGKKNSSYTIPAGVKMIAPYAFYSCSNLTDISFPDGLETIGQSAFAHCSGLKSVELPNSLLDIGYGAFFDCYNLSKITFPDSLQSIGQEAFSNNYGVTGVHIPGSVTNIGTDAFHNCSHLGSITVDDKNSKYYDVDGVLYDRENKELLCYPRMHTGDSYVIPSGVESIGPYAFYNAVYLKNITIPSTVKTIKEGAFSHCSALTTAVLPEGIQSISDFVFESCTSLESVDIPDSVTSIGANAFFNCKNLKGLTLSENVKSLSSNTFAYCTSLTEVAIPASLTSVSSTAFYACSGLKALHVAEENTAYTDVSGVLYNKAKTVLIYYPCGRTTADGSYTVLNTTTTLSSYAFAYSCLKKIDLPAVVANLGNYTFSYCGNLKNVIIRNKTVPINTYIFNATNTSKMMISGYFGSTAERYAYKYNIIFRQLDNITEGLIINNAGVVIGYTGTDTVIKVPSSIDVGEGENKTPVAVTAIGQNAFHNPNDTENTVYKTITKVELPLSVKNINVSAFEGCSSLTTAGLVLPESIQTIAAYAFHDCTSLTGITIPINVSKLSASAFDGCSALKEIKVNGNNSYFADIDGVLTIKSKKTLLRVPEGFTGKENTYDIPTVVTSVDPKAFAGCTGIKKIAIKYLEYIGQRAFKGAFTSPVEIELATVEDIDAEAFADCTGITSIIIPKTVNRIGDDVFKGCDNLSRIEVEPGNNKYTADEEGVLFSKDKVALVCYPKGRTKDTYTIPATVRQIYSAAFYQCTNLKEIIMDNDSVVLIQDNAFEGCNFNTITLPESLEEIGDKAFANNEGLLEISLPLRVGKIGAMAFSGCPKLAHVYVYNKDAVFSQNGKVFAEEVYGPDDTPVLTIHGFKGSTAEQYTQNRNLLFQPLSDYEVKKTELLQKISDAETLLNAAVEGSDPGQYQSGSKEALQTVITISENTARNMNSTTTQLADALTELETAITNFKAAMVPIISNKAILEDLLNAVNDACSNAQAGTMPGQYPTGAKEDFKAEIDRAEGIYNNSMATQNEVDGACAIVEQAFRTFAGTQISDLSISYAKLPAEIIIATVYYQNAQEGYALGQYRGGSKKTFREAITQADTFLKQIGSSTTQSQVNEAISSLRGAESIFEQSKNLTDKSQLMEEIQKSQALYNSAVVGTEPGQYKQENKDAYLTEINNAIKVMNSNDAVQQQVDDMVSTLQQARNIFQSSQN